MVLLLVAPQQKVVNFFELATFFISPANQKITYIYPTVKVAQCRSQTRTKARIPTIAKIRTTASIAIRTEISRKISIWKFCAQFTDEIN